MSNHCWHADRSMVIGQPRECCCFCGTARRLSTVPPPGHGPFLPEFSYTISSRPRRVWLYEGGVLPSQCPRAPEDKGAGVVKILVITGGQTGADQGALRAAAALGVETGGLAPKGYLTEDGPNPDLGEKYGLAEAADQHYRSRTVANVRSADFVLWFGNPDSSGGRLTLGEAARRDIHRFVVQENLSNPAEAADAVWVELEQTASWSTFTLMCAGNRESVNPGIGKFTEEFFHLVLARLLGKLLAENK